VSTARLAVLASACLWAYGCTPRYAPVVPGPSEQPRASWILRSASNGREREICRSDRPAPCVIVASSGALPSTVSVQVYLYPAGAPTKYSGAFMAGFIETTSGRGYETKVDYTIQPSQQPTAVSAFGRVTPRPGEYAFRMALLAEVPNYTDPHQFTESIPVRVVERGSAN
jgi:hypothetical protein